MAQQPVKIDFLDQETTYSDLNYYVTTKGLQIEVLEYKNEPNRVRIYCINSRGKKAKGYIEIPVSKIRDINNVLEALQ